MEQRYEQLETEKRNERTEHIDECTTLEILELINVEDGKVAKAVEKALPQIVDAVEVICLNPNNCLSGSLVANANASVSIYGLPIPSTLIKLA